eukprot:scaffold34127_cov77-Phaeocystis_antarctica.AAC.2
MRQSTVEQEQEHGIETPVEAEARQLKQKCALASTAYALASAGPIRRALRKKHECRMTDCDDC